MRQEQFVKRLGASFVLLVEARVHKGLVFPPALLEKPVVYKLN